MPRLTVTPTFVAVCVVLGAFAGQDLRDREVHVLPRFPPQPADPLDPAYVDAVIRAGSTPIESSPLPWTWIFAGAVGAALIYALSVLLHELGHFLAAKGLKADVEGITLNAAGGFVEFADDGLTRARFALIVAAGPLVTALLVAGIHLAAPDAFPETPAGIVADRLVPFALVVNALALAVNLLPFRGLDGWHLLRSAPRRRARGGTHPR